jgi:hypothetical protein
MIIIMMFIMIIGLTHLSHADQPKTATEATFCSTVPGSASILLHSVEQLDCPAAQWSFSVKKIQKNCTVKKFAQLLRLVSHIPKDITHVCLIHPTIGDVFTTFVIWLCDIPWYIATCNQGYH